MWREFLREDLDFEKARQQVWEYQLAHNPVLREFHGRLGLEGPCFLPISFFKHLEVKSGGNWDAALTFESSRTTGQQASRHFVKEPEIYQQSLLKGFFHFYKRQKYRILALLPNYLERQNSSLVYMVQEWIQQFGSKGSGFYLYDHDQLARSLREAIDQGENILLIGVSFALLDFAEQHSLPLPQGSIVMETGGMKGRREELTREQLHTKLKEAFSISAIHSEYGMTELLSQAYSPGNGRFYCPPWMQIRIGDPYDPGTWLECGKTGRVHIIDLMNLHSCAFIRTDDLGRAHPDGGVEILGRLDHAEMRGCNLLYES